MRVKALAIADFLVSRIVAVPLDEAMLNSLLQRSRSPRQPSLTTFVAARPRRRDAWRFGSRSVPISGCCRARGALDHTPPGDWTLSLRREWPRPRERDGAWLLARPQAHLYANRLMPKGRTCTGSGPDVARGRT